MKQYVLVAGVDYVSFGTDYRKYCEHRKTHFVAANRTAKEDLRFHVVDVRRGEVVRTDVTYPGGTKAETTSVDGSYDPVGPSSYSSGRFRPGQRGVLSILDVYDVVQGIGRTDPGTLVELSLFSHGYWGGPVLVNSYDNRQWDATGPFGDPMPMPVPPGFRDPDDKDPRGHLDFQPPAMQPADLQAFRDAFAADGRAWQWGCSFPPAYHELLYSVTHSPEYEASGLAPTDELTLRVRGDARRILDATVGEAAFPGEGLPATGPVTIEFRYVVHTICRVLQVTYAQQLATAAGVTTYAPPVGFGSVPGSTDADLLSVSGKLPKRWNFYREYMNATLDPEGHRYMAYEPGRTCPVPAVGGAATDAATGGAAAAGSGAADGGAADDPATAP